VERASGETKDIWLVEELQKGFVSKRVITSSDCGIGPGPVDKSFSWGEDCYGLERTVRFQRLA